VYPFVSSRSQAQPTKAIVHSSFLQPCLRLSGAPVPIPRRRRTLWVRGITYVHSSFKNNRNYDLCCII